MQPKGKSPFYPGQPVPVELFAGRASEISMILEQGAGQTALGKPSAMFVEGEYGIGKSSIAQYTMLAAEKIYGLTGIYVTVGGAQSVEDIARMVMEAAVRILSTTNKGTIKEFTAKYIKAVHLFGVDVNTEALKNDARQLTSALGFLSFLQTIYKQLGPSETQGIFLIMDEINGITENPAFAHFIKGIIDTNSSQAEPLPLFLMLCGAPERRAQMIKNHQPVDRIFKVIQILKFIY